MDDMGSLIPRCNEDRDSRLGGRVWRFESSEADPQRDDDCNPDQTAKGCQEKEKIHNNLLNNPQQMDS